MSNYKHVGSYTKSKGVIVLYYRNKTKVEYVVIGILLSFQLKIKNESVRILGC